ncbi:MAG: hypothetical protein K2X27_07985, partial [Candidatus Obscuribacterales bacterium]|nr:hypothetical protein [Candidatus Obscuribacterales bacterium]
MGKTLRSKTLYQDRDWLFDKYVNEKLSTVEIARIYREQENRWCDPNTISRWLKKHDIPMRTLAEAQQNRHASETASHRQRQRRRRR